MKYCPYCGAELIDSAVSFCSECGKKLAVPPQTESKPKEKSKARKVPAVEQPLETHEYEENDRGNDGYYDDVLPEDNADTRQGLDKKMVKSIALLGVAVIFIIGLAVLAMYFL